MKQTALHILAKPIGPKCNLDCPYCFYLEKEMLYPEAHDFEMPRDILEKYIQGYIDAQPTSVVHFTWQGGEPTLLGLPWFQEVVRLQKRYAGDKQIRNALQTNGILLDDAWGEFLHDNDFLVGISVDGPVSVHNQFRKNKAGVGSFRQVMSGLEVLKKHGVEFNILTVVHRGNQDQTKIIYDFLKSTGCRHWQFIPAVERLTSDAKLASPASEDAELTDWSVEPAAYGEFLCRIFQRWVREDVGQIHIQQFEAALANELGRSAGVCVWNATCGQSLALEHTGDLYSCDHYVFPEFHLGNIMEQGLIELAQSKTQHQFGLDKLEGLTRTCRECDVLYLCHGECPKHRFDTGEYGEKGHNYLCAGYKHFFTTIRPELGVLKEILELGQPAENIMEWMQEKDAGFPNLKVSDSDPCPCGSGKSFEDCCSHKREMEN